MYIGKGLMSDFGLTNRIKGYSRWSSFKELIKAIQKVLPSMPKPGQRSCDLLPPTTVMEKALLLVPSEKAHAKSAISLPSKNPTRVMLASSAKWSGLGGNSSITTLSTPLEVVNSSILIFQWMTHCSSSSPLPRTSPSRVAKLFLMTMVSASSRTLQPR